MFFSCTVEGIILERTTSTLVIKQRLFSVLSIKVLIYFKYFVLISSRLISLLIINKTEIILRILSPKLFCVFFFLFVHLKFLDYVLEMIRQWTWSAKYLNWPFLLERFNKSLEFNGLLFWNFLFLNFNIIYDWLFFRL